jgi:GT2 family glycosyltransferase
MERVARLSIVVVTWNSARYLPRCLAGIREQTWPDVEVIVVDNASTDDSRAIAANAHVIANDTNRGFSAAVNQGIRAATGEWIVLCNPDAYLAPDYTEKLIRAMREGIGMAGGKLFRGEGDDIRATELIDSKGIRMTRSGRHLDIGQGKRDGEDDRGLAANGECFGISGAAPLYRRAMIDDVSIDGEFLDEDFFAYREDADVAWRAQLLGWRALHVPEAMATHVRTVTPERRRQLSAAVNLHSVKNRFLLRLKNEGWLLALRNAPFELARDVVVLAAALTVERSSLPAFAWLWKNRRRIMAKRREIQRRRRVPDRALAKWFR